jgi:hypothetical protein
VIGLALVLVGGDSAAGSDPVWGRFGSIVIAVLGVLLIIVALRNARRPDPGPGEDGPAGRLWRVVDGATPIRSLGVGVLVATINVKNLAIFLSAVSVVHLSNLLLAQKITGVVLVTLVFCLPVVLPVLLHFLFPRTAQRSADVAEAIARHAPPWHRYLDPTAVRSDLPVARYRRIAVKSDDPIVLPLTATRTNDLALVGGKGASLGELTHAGFPCPQGSV